MQKKEEKPKRIRDPLDIGRIPPSCIDIESAVLGSIIRDNAFHLIVTTLRAEMFYTDVHQKIFKAALDLFEENHPIDALTISEQLKTNGELELVGGRYYISQLTAKTVTSINVTYHAQIIKQKFCQREIIRICSDAIRDSFEDTTDLFDVHDKLLEDIKSLGISKEHTESHEDLDETVMNMFVEMEAGAKEGAINSYKSRSPFMTEVLQYSPGNIILMASKSGAGKTTITTDEAFGIIENYPEDVSIQWWLMEDIPKNIVRQYIGREMGLTIKELSNKGYTMSKEEITIAKSYQNKLNSYDITFKKGRAHIKTIRNSFYQWKNKLQEKHKGKKHFYILIIDNIKQLMDNDQMNLFRNQTAIDDHIAINIKSISTENQEDTLIWVLHHLGKEQIQSKGAVNGYRPIENDLKGSESFAAISTQIILLNRPNGFPDLLKEYKDDDRYETLKRLIILECIKNRIIGTLGLVYRLGSESRYIDDLHLVIN